MFRMNLSRLTTMKNKLFVGLIRRSSIIRFEGSSESPKVYTNALLSNQLYTGEWLDEFVEC